MVRAHRGRRKALGLMEVSFDKDEEVSLSKSGYCAYGTTRL